MEGREGTVYCCDRTRSPGSEAFAGTEQKILGFRSIHTEKCFPAHAYPKLREYPHLKRELWNGMAESTERVC